MQAADITDAATPTLGYWKIRGLAAALRMMYHYKNVPFMEVAYGEDASSEWFGGDKPKLAAKNVSRLRGSCRLRRSIERAFVSRLISR